ncbi:MAG TPA: amidohydrolase family protein [Methylomirabilota bacterium]|nr:amidohydrolase family protein [Methylomirabilota bacterium]
MLDSSNWDLLVVGGTVLTLEPGSEPIPDGAVAIADGRIAAVGLAEDLLELAPTGEVVNAGGCLILPGFVNTHSHLAMTLLRGLADDVPLKQWLEEHIWPAEKTHMGRDAVRLGTELAVAEQLLGGVTTTTDMYFFAEDVAQVVADAGMRGVIAESLIDSATPRCETPDEMWRRQRELAEALRGHPLITASVAAHAPYSVAATNLVREAELAEEFHIPFQIHLSETRWEVEKLLEEKGRSPVAYLADLGVLSERTVAAHCVHVSPADIEILAEFEVGVAHNPVSNLKLASGVAPVPAMVAAGLKVGIGTDGAASSNTLDVLGDTQLAALLHKGVAGDPTVLPARAMVEMATIGGARVLGLDDEIGTLAEGKQADLVCISVDGAHATPLYDPFSHLVFAARASDVRHVLIRGKLVVGNRSLNTLDFERIRTEVRELIRRIRP